MKSLKDAEASVGTSDNFGAFSVDAERAIHHLENMSFRKGMLSYLILLLSNKTRPTVVIFHIRELSICTTDGFCDGKKL